VWKPSSGGSSNPYPSPWTLHPEPRTLHPAPCTKPCTKPRILKANPCTRLAVGEADCWRRMQSALSCNLSLQLKPSRLKARRQLTEDSQAIPTT